MNPTPFNEVISDRLHELDMSQRQLAKRVEAGSATINQLMLARFEPSRRLLREIARALEMRPESIHEYRLEAIRDELDWRPPPEKRSRELSLDNT